IGSLLLGLAALSIAPKAWTSRVFAGVYLILILLFWFANIPGVLDSITGKGRPVEPVAAVAEAAEPEAETEPAATVAETAEPEAEEGDATEGGIKGRKSGRKAIYDTYLAAIGEKPIFGHGFGAEQKLLVQLDPGLFAEADAHLANTEWNPHSVHLAVLYFGGGVGFLIHVALLGSICFFAYRRCRETGNWSYLLSAAWVIFAAAAVATESTLIAYDKEPVLLRYPNEYWIYYWGAIIFGIIQTALKPEELSEP
ncbi:MAG: hypothetical protein AAF585_07660, partial [Verrucomicrobiota bacterium]